MVKNGEDWAISSQAPNRGRFNDYPVGGSRGKRPEAWSPKPLRWQGEDIVCALAKVRDALSALDRRSESALYGIKPEWNFV